MKTKLTFVKTWEASGNGVFEPDMIVSKAYKSVFASYRPKHFLYFQKDNEKNLGEAYDSQEELSKFNVAGFKDFCDKRYLKRFFLKIVKAIDDNRKVTVAIEKENLDNISKGQLAKLLKNSINSMKLNFSCFLACQPQRFSELEKWIQVELLKNTPTNKVGDIFRTLSTPIESTPISDEQSDWLRLVVTIKKEKLSSNSKQYHALINNHWAKYAILGAADGKEPWTKDRYIETLEKETRPVAVLKSELNKITQRGRKLKRQQQFLISRYRVTRKSQYYCNLLAKVGHQRLLLRINGWMPLYESMKKVVRTVAKNFDYDSDLVRYCTVDELMDVSIGVKMSQDLLRKRRNVFLLLYEYPHTKVFYGHDAEKRFRELVPFEDFEKIKEVKGTIAMKGKVVGKVLLFQWGDNMTEKIKKIRDGEKIILVTGQTRPQLMPLIAKSAAIVTDEGGIISHSAIVSRELGIPCIVGTRIGTRVFKDGDTIEVDADIGVARLIKR